MADLVPSLVAKYFPHSRESLVVAGGVSVIELAQKHGTPFFLYDHSVLSAKYDALRAALPARFSIYYSIKANPAVPVVRHFLDCGCGLEIASAGEFRRALEAGCSADRMVFAGPGKLERELELALGEGIGEIHVESRTEAHRISAIAKRTGRRARIALRINPTGEAEGGAMRMGGRSTPFGFDEESLDEVLHTVLALPGLDLTGVHIFTGTQIVDAAVLLGQYRHGLELARRVAARLQRPLETIDFGGGFGVPYFSHEHELDLAAVRTGLDSLCAEADSEAALASARFIVEPGRFLTAEAGIYIAGVNDIKVSRSKKFLVLDGGMNHHLAASGNLGQTIKRNYPIALLNKLTVPATESVDIVGPLCTPLDTLARSIAVPAAEIGDLVGIFQSGAYGRSASPLGFLSHPAPQEIFMQENQVQAFIDPGNDAAFQHYPSPAGSQRKLSVSP